MCIPTHIYLPLGGQVWKSRSVISHLPSPEWRTVPQWVPKSLYTPWNMKNKMLCRQLSIIWPQILIAEWLDSLAVMPQVSSSIVYWQTGLQSSKILPSHFVMMKAVQANPILRCLIRSHDGYSVGFSSGNSRGCRLFKFDWLCFSEGGNKLGK